jgi:Rrf2 family protein
MKLSTKGRYGARLMLDLALHYGTGPVLLRDIAERQDISEKYLGHLIQPLKTAGLINASRGAHGGYQLAKPPDQIDLAEVVQAAEGDLCLVECVSNPLICDRNEGCVTRDIWEELSVKVDDLLRSVTLQDMVNRQNRKQTSRPLMYHI